jgi:prevent-host-death family protein
MVSVKTVSALDVRKHFGQLLDEAAAGERIIIERAGQPRAALVPLKDLREVDPDARLARQLTALDEIERLARLKPFPDGFDAVAAVREMRADRTAQVMRAVAGGRDRRAR